MSIKTEDSVSSVCDRCGKSMASTEGQSGPKDTEWEGSNLCNDCYAEVEEEVEDDSGEEE